LTADLADAHSSHAKELDQKQALAVELASAIAGGGKSLPRHRRIAVEKAAMSGIAGDLPSHRRPECRRHHRAPGHRTA
jgi:hypothetical protein